VVAVAGAEGELLGRLPLAVCSQHGDGGRVHLDPAAAGGGLGSPYREVLAVQVDVGPLQRHQLTDPHAGRRGELPEGGEAICRSCNAARSAHLAARVLSRYMARDPSPGEVSGTLRTQPPPVVG
jgi:hypothetical protein